MVWLVVALFAILFIIMVVPSIPQSNSYGKWEITKGRCIPKAIYNNNHSKSDNIDYKCEDGGIREVYHKCIPNPISGWGCKWGGRQSFDMHIEKEDCPVSCSKMKWKKVSESECYNFRKFVTYECRENDTKGTNLCVNNNKSGKVVQYKLGDTIISTEICDNPIDFSEEKIQKKGGKWITIHPEASDNVVAKYADLSESTMHLGTPLCPSELPLGVGEIKGKIGCLYEGQTYTGAKANEMCMEPRIEPSMIKCFKVDMTMKYGTLFDDFGNFVALSHPSKKLINIYNEVGGLQQNQNYSILDLFMDSYIPIDGYSKDQVIATKACKFYFAKYNYVYYIFLLGPDGKNGWLSGGRWHQAKLGPDMVGKLINDITPYKVKFENGKVTIRDLSGNFLYIRLGSKLTPVFNFNFKQMSYQFSDFIEK